MKITKSKNSVFSYIKKIISAIKRNAGQILKRKSVLSKNKIKNLIAKDNPVIFEIGSANGDDTLDFLQTFNNVNLKLYGFEPEPKNIAILKKKINSDKFILFEGVISDVDGEVTFNRSRTDNSNDLSFSGSIMKPKNHLKIWDWIYFDEMMKVSSTTLDRFCEKNKIDVIDFIWCDAQGAEGRIIAGGEKAFKNKVRFLYTEYSNDEQYENQPSLKRILELLPSFDIVDDYGGKDVILRNKNL